MDRKLDDLSDAFRPLAYRLIAKITEAQIAVFIVDTLRTPEEQADAIARGVSWTTHSRHLTGDAIDLVPYELYRRGWGPLNIDTKLKWDPTAPEWAKMASIGREMGLVCGFDWARRDSGHFEMPWSPHAPVA